MEIGVPNVLPSKVPERIWTLSDSFRGETIFDWPGRRRSRSGWMSASFSSSRGGHPSTTTPIPSPCDSPHVVMQKSLPNVFAMHTACRKPGRWSNQEPRRSLAPARHRPGLMKNGTRRVDRRCFWLIFQMERGRNVWVERISQDYESDFIHPLFRGSNVSQSGHQHRADSGAVGTHD